MGDARLVECLGSIPILRLRARSGNGIFFRGWGSVSDRFPFRFCPFGGGGWWLLGGGCPLRPLRPLHIAPAWIAPASLRFARFASPVSTLNLLLY